MTFTKEELEIIHDALSLLYVRTEDKSIEGQINALRARFVAENPSQSVAEWLKSEGGR
jgi:hypothetical protein